MKTSDLARCALGICALIAILAGCGGSQSRIGSLSSQYVPSANAAAKRSAGTVSFKVLHYFGKGSDGSELTSSPIVLNGTLYGTTLTGGKSDNGTVYSSTTNGTEKVLHSFSSSEGYNPRAGLLDVKGTLYGTTDFGPAPYGGYGYGTVFDITTSGSENMLYAFGGAPDGNAPWGTLIDVNGTLYGTTIYGGKYDLGTVFSITTSGTETVLHSFGKGSDGSRPEAGLVNLNGTLYGTTATGGNTSYSTGTVFSITTSGTETVLHRFGGVPDGQNPQASLIDVKGTLYGTTYSGGAHGGGTVFSVTTSGKLNVMYSFNHGTNPQASLIDMKGTLYGTTAYGGTYGLGTVFSVTTSGGEKTLYSFKGSSPNACKDGCLPAAGLLDLKGTLYGTTLAGGKFDTTRGYDDGGTLFALTP